MNGRWVRETNRSLFQETKKNMRSLLLIAVVTLLFVIKIEADASRRIDRRPPPSIVHRQGPRPRPPLRPRQRLVPALRDRRRPPPVLKRRHGQNRGRFPRRRHNNPLEEFVGDLRRLFRARDIRLLRLERQRQQQQRPQQQQQVLFGELLRRLAANLTNKFGQDLEELSDSLRQLPDQLRQQLDRDLQKLANFPFEEDLERLQQLVIDLPANISKKVESDINHILELPANFSRKVEGDIQNLRQKVEDDIQHLIDLPANISRKVENDINHMLEPAKNFTRQVREKVEGDIQQLIDLPDTVQNFTDRVRQKVEDDIEEVEGGIRQGLETLLQLPQNLTRRVREKVESDLQSLMELPKNLTAEVKGKAQEMGLPTSIEEWSEIPGNLSRMAMERVGLSQLDVDADLLTTLLVMADPLNLTATSAAKLNELRGHVAEIADVLVNGDAEDLDRIKRILKTIPSLIPYIVEAHVPKLEHFLEGSRFTLSELHAVHESLADFEAFVRLKAVENEKAELPTVDKILNLVSEKNMRLMSFVFALMVRADTRPDVIVVNDDGVEEKAVALTLKDVRILESRLVSTRDIFTVLELA